MAPEEYRPQDHEEEGGEHLLLPPEMIPPSVGAEIYSANDMDMLHDMRANMAVGGSHMKTLDELLERDKQREKDGFPRKIRLGKLVKPGKGGAQKIVVIPSATEEKFYHDTRDLSEENEQSGEGSPSGGSGDGEEGEVIGEEPIHQQGGEGAGGAGQGQGGEHDMGSDAYELGKVLTEKFQLPNLQDKGRKRSLTRYSYDLTNRNRGEGQVIDKKATMKQILKTNIGLGRIEHGDDVDTDDLLVHKGDFVYRVLAKERDFESQAVVFFVRDYSGSMQGAPTELVVSQHILIYSWLVYQYENQVESRFVVHDTKAKEVPDFHTYANVTVAGGTKVASAMRLINEIVADENLARDNNIYVFYGGDGDDWDSNGKDCIEELKHMLTYASRIGLLVARNAQRTSTFERYIEKSGLLEEFPNLIRMDQITVGANEDRVIESIKKVIS